MNRSTRWVLLAGIVVLGVAIRGYQLTTRSIWFDEAFTWRLIQFPWDAVVARASQDVHPPLYYLVMKLWATVFGSSILALRSFSISAAALLVVAVYGFTRAITRTPSTALMAALLVAINSWQIAPSTEARMYTLAALVSICMVWALYRHHWPAFTIMAITLAYTHYYGLLVLTAALVWFAGQQLVRARFRLGEVFTSRVVWYGVAAVGITALAYLPWVPLLLQQLQQVQHTFWIPPLTHWSVPETLYRMVLGPTAEPQHTPWSKAILTLVPTMSLLLVCVCLLLRKRTRRAALFLSTVIIGTLVLSISISLMSQSIYQDRYFLPIHSLILILLAIAGGELKPRLLQRIALAAMVLFFAFGTQQHYQRLDLPHRSGVRGAIAYLASQNQEQAPLVVSSPLIFFPVLYYQHEEFSNLPTGQARLPAPRLSLPAANLTHFAGAPVLRSTDILAPDFFTRNPPAPFWAVDTTGFSSAPLVVPPVWQKTSEATFREVYPVQGDVTMRHYEPAWPVR